MPGSAEQFMAEARTMIADGYPGRAAKNLSDWISKHKDTNDPYLSRAYLLRGDARVAMGNEYKALYDYEKVIREFPSSPEFVTAVERELAIAIEYANGMRRRAFGFRVSGAKNVGERLLILVDERMPSSRLAETAGIELADYYYREGDLEFADMAYEMFLRFYANSRYRMHAMKHRVFAAISRFKGPRYDATMLTDARLLIDDFESEFPAEADRENMDGLKVWIDEGEAAQTLEKARWYLKRSDLASARFLLKRVVRDHPTTVSARVALDELAQRGWIESPEAAPSDAEVDIVIQETIDEEGADLPDADLPATDTPSDGDQS